MRADATMRGDSVRANDVHPDEPLKHGAYLCLSVPAGGRSAAALAAVATLAERLGLRNEYEPGNGEAPASLAYVRRIGATPGQIEDEPLWEADAIVHVAGPTAEPVAEFCAEAARLLGPGVRTAVRSGVLRPPLYTGNAMHNFAYAHRVLQQPGALMPNAFFLPTSKTADWWRKGWMERHTYFLPRYDEAGNPVRDGHALAAQAGVECLFRRTYKQREEPATEGCYDFLNYFECADDDRPSFHAVVDSLRNVERNPEWAFVREGPLWQGRRVATWEELFTAP